MLGNVPQVQDALKRKRSRCSIRAPVRLRSRRWTSRRPRTRAAGRSVSVMRAPARLSVASAMGHLIPCERKQSTTATRPRPRTSCSPRGGSGRDLRRISPYSLASPPDSGPVGAIPTVGRPYTFHQGTHASSRYPARPLVAQLRTTIRDCGSRASASFGFNSLGTFYALCQKKDSVQKGVVNHVGLLPLAWVAALIPR